MLVLVLVLVLEMYRHGGGTTGGTAVPVLPYGAFFSVYPRVLCACGCGVVRSLC